MPQYTVVSPIKYKGERHQPGGDPVEMPEKVARPLLEGGELTLFASKSKEEQKDKK